jgi:hypothetical protein
MSLLVAKLSSRLLLNIFAMPCSMRLTMPAATILLGLLWGISLQRKCPTPANPGARRRVIATLGDDPTRTTGPNQAWAMGWMYDELFDSRRVRVRNVVDTWTVAAVIRALKAKTCLVRPVRCVSVARKVVSGYNLYSHAVGVRMVAAGKTFGTALLVASVTMLGAGSAARSDEGPLEVPLRPHSHVHKRYVERFFGPRSHYARAVQTGVYDSCWRRRVIFTRWGPEVLSKWICRDYTTYGSHFDWGYGRAPADRFYGDPWW